MTMEIQRLGYQPQALYRLDLATILGQYVGRSETRFREALDTAGGLGPGHGQPMPGPDAAAPPTDAMHP